MNHISEVITHIKTFLKREPVNSVDSSAVAVWREEDIVGQVPFNIASVLSHSVLENRLQPRFCGGHW